MSSPDTLLQNTLQRLREVRLSLLKLHKALLFSERTVYEQFHGRVRSPNEFFHLVTEHEWFGWLRPMSQLIVRMDDVLHAKEPVILPQVTELLDQTRALLEPDNSGTSPQKRYFHAIQRDPDIALMHAEISRLLASEI